MTTIQNAIADHIRNTRRASDKEGQGKIAVPHDLEQRLSRLEELVHDMLREERTPDSSLAARFSRHFNAKS
jgi:hypothetical protein